ncbi:hypothetical protein H0H81_002815 [Sphagnurus paluster]|uniref:Uncharacterized protein n=1 Tax=Sphagnurus paluster TaxID=117069 RepID=A0A9P7GT56_9AGAR|nr:hypothetical protein H0H81_002815 [Sphagnurus paluster]
MSNPNRGRGGFANGRGAHQQQPSAADHPTIPQVQPQPSSPAHASHHTEMNGASVGHAGRGFPRGGRGFGPQFRGRGGLAPGFDRGRGVPRGAFRGRGRGSFTAPLPS